MAAPMKYPPQLRERAIRLYRTSRPRPAIAHLADQLEVHREALRGWIRADEGSRGAGAPPHPVKTGAAKAAKKHEELLILRQHNAELEKENAELRRANDILKVASAFFARELDPIRR